VVDETDAVGKLDRDGCRECDDVAGVAKVAGWDRYSKLFVNAGDVAKGAHLGALPLLVQVGRPLLLEDWRRVGRHWGVWTSGKRGRAIAWRLLSSRD
jgi:hypothetical protein